MIDQYFPRSQTHVKKKKKKKKTDGELKIKPSLIRL